MKEYSFFHKQTGVFHGRVVVADEVNAVANIPEGHELVEGRFDPVTHRVDMSASPLCIRDITSGAAIDSIEMREVADSEELIPHPTTPLTLRATLTRHCGTPRCPRTAVAS